MQNVYAFNAVKNHSSCMQLRWHWPWHGPQTGRQTAAPSVWWVYEPRCSTAVEHPHPLTHVTTTTTCQHNILIHWHTSPWQQHVNTVSSSTDTHHHSNNKSTQHPNPLTHVTTTTTQQPHPLKHVTMATTCTQHLIHWHMWPRQQHITKATTSTQNLHPLTQRSVEMFQDSHNEPNSNSIVHSNKVTLHINEMGIICGYILATSEWTRDTYS